MNSEWKKIEIGSLLKEIRNGHEPNQVEDIPYVGLEHIEKESLRLCGVSSSLLADSTKKKFTNKDILFGTLRPYFKKLATPSFEGICSTDIAVLRPKHETDKRFLLYLISSQPIIDYASVIANGTKMPRAKWKVISKLKLNLPELKQREIIGNLLGDYDQLIDCNTSRIVILEQLAEQIYKEWFVRMRFPGYETTTFAKGVPNNWKIKTIGSTVRVLMGQSPKSEFYNEDRVGLPFHQGVGSYGEVFPKHDIYCSVNGRIANVGDILFSVRAPVGRLNIADRKLIIGRGLSAMSHKKGYNSYLFHFLKNQFGTEDLIGNGSIFNSVGKDELNNFKYYEPSEPLIQEFEKIVHPIDLEIKNLYTQIHELKILRNLILPRLLNGQLSTENLTREFTKTA